MGILQQSHVTSDDGYTLMTPKGVMTFVALSKKFKSKDDEKEGDGAYIVSLLLPKEADLGPLYKAADEIAREKLGSKAKGVNFSKDICPGLRTPFLKAQQKLTNADDFGGVEALEGRILLRANTYNARPPVVNIDGKTVDPDELDIEVYRGRLARIEVRAHAYNSATNVGVKFYLQGVQLLGKGTPIGNSGVPGKPSAALATPVVDDDEEV